MHRLVIDNKRMEGDYAIQEFRDFMVATAISKDQAKQESNPETSGVRPHPERIARKFKQIFWFAKKVYGKFAAHLQPASLWDPSNNSSDPHAKKWAGESKIKGFVGQSCLLTEYAAIFCAKELIP